MRNSTKFVLSLAMAFCLVGMAKAQTPSIKIYVKNWTAAKALYAHNQGCNTDFPKLDGTGLNIEKASAAENIYDTQVQVADGIPTIIGKDYTVRLRMRGTQNGTIACGFGTWGDGKADFKYDINVTTEMQDVDILYTNAIASDSWVIVWAGTYAGTLSIESVEVYCNSVFEQDGYIIFDGSKGTNIWDKQGVYTLSTPTEADKTYCVSIQCKAENPDGVSDFVLWPKKSSDGSSFYGMAAFKLTNEFETYSWWFIPGEGFDKLTFQMGNYDGKIYIDDVTCREVINNDPFIFGDEMVTNGSFSYPGLYGWSVDGSATMFRDVHTKSVDVTAAGYATFSTDKALDLANISGGTAYIVADQSSNGSVPLTEINTAVPANTGLLIKCEGGGTVTIPVANSGVAPTTNYLVASDGTEVGVNNYVFAYENGTFANPGFYQLTEKTTVPTGKAYLSSGAIPPAAKANFLPFEGTASEVIAPEVEETEEEEVLYNMAGVRVDKNFKGFVINQKGVKRFNR